MSINGVRNNSQSDRPGGVLEITSERSTPLLETATGPSTPLVSTTHNASGGDLPNPAVSWQERQRQLDELIGVRDQIRTLALAGDPAAQQILAEIEQAIPLLEQQLSQDIDGDSVPDAFDADDDNDSISDAREIRDGTNPNVIDSDGDGISDDNEIRLRNLGRQLGDQRLARLGNGNSADANQDGIIDSAQLTQEVRSQLGISSEGASHGGVETVGTQSAGDSPTTWGSPSADATTIEINPGANQEVLPEGGGTFVIQAPEDGGQMRVQRQGSSLRIDYTSSEGNQRVIIPDFQEKKIYFFGSADVQFVNMNRDEFLTTNSFGYAETGIYVASGSDPWANGTMTVTSHASPFDDPSIEPTEPAEDREGVHEVEYDISETEDLTFRMLEGYNGEELTQWTIDQDGQSIRVEGKNRGGETRVRFTLRGGIDHLDQLTFQLADTGQRVDSTLSARINGGRGDDMANTVGGTNSIVHLGAGDDTGTVTNDGRVQFFGQAGDDILKGAAGDDILNGGGGNDYIHGGTGANRLYGEAGDDTIWTLNTTIGSGTSEVVDGGAGGTDITNAYNGSVVSAERGIAGLNGLQTYLAQYSATGATPVELSEIINMEQEDLPYLRQLISGQLEQMAINYLLLKETERAAWYTENPGSGQVNAWNQNGGPGTQQQAQPNGDQNPEGEQGGGWPNGYAPLG